MTTIDIKDAGGNAAGTAEVSSDVFGIEPNVHVMHHVPPGVRARTTPAPAARFAAAAASRSARRAPAVRVRAPSARLTTPAAAWSSARIPATTRSA